MRTAEGQRRGNPLAARFGQMMASVSGGGEKEGRRVKTASCVLSRGAQVSVYVVHRGVPLIFLCFMSLCVETSS